MTENTLKKSREGLGARLLLRIAKKIETTKNSDSNWNGNKRDGSGKDPQYRKRGYPAYAVEWTEDTTEEVLQMVSTASVFTSSGKEYIMIRTEYGIDTLTHGAFIVQRQNGTVTWYKTREEFLIQYETLSEREL